MDRATGSNACAIPTPRSFCSKRVTGDDVSRAWPLERHPLSLETSMPGVLAFGDVRRGSAKRVAAAAGEGAVAIQFVHRLLEEERTVAQ